ncbi:hypothetical protein [Streptomyces antimycoticus]|uniref:hypothetical protein n=1 Tax=Streptomyces TaxID=1883 RepID=UPI0033E49AE6
MRTRAAAATAALLLAALTACGGGEDSTKPAAAPKSSASKSASPKVNCDDTSLSQTDWMKHCSGGAGTDGDAAAETKELAWGKPAQTVGAMTPVGGQPGGGDLEVTPTTVVYQKTAMGNTAANGVYAIITVRDKATGEKAATESAMIEGGGWQWIAPDGQALAEGENDASSITPNGFTGGGMVKAGTWQWGTVAFDLTEAQRGGTLAYTDGAGATFKWKVPAKDNGPELAALKKGMEGDY